MSECFASFLALDIDCYAQHRQSSSEGRPRIQGKFPRTDPTQAHFTLFKFNIFYPDLIDKSKAPTYKIVKEPGNDETVLLHFSAGPPYEDIAFRIVNREWEFSHKRCGFFVLRLLT